MATHGHEKAAGPVPPPAPPGGGLKPQPGDVGRLLRRGMREVVKAARAEDVPELARLLHAHLGPTPSDVAVVEESWPAYDHVNVQTGLDAWLEDREHRLIGLTNFRHRDFGLPDLLSVSAPTDPYGTRPGNVAMVNLASGPNGEVRPCVVAGVYLVTEAGRPLALLLRGPDPNGMRKTVTVEVVGHDRDVAAAVARDVRRLALQHNVFRRRVVSFGGDVFGNEHTFMRFHQRPSLDRRHLVLPVETLAAIERQVVGVARHRDRLLASEQHLKRGLLLYGPPGTGKTHTIRYLLSRLADTTVVLLSGNALHLVAEACSVARSLQPAMVVIEDVDLIAEDRGFHPGQHPLLFQLLNEMDGLEDDVDVVFVLTTNRADLLEPALAARPGRVDQAVELVVPDESARRQLLELYRGRLKVDVADLSDVVDRTAGVTASFLKELLRRSAVRAAAEAGESGESGDAGAGTDGTEPLAVTADQVGAALDELLDTRNALTRVLIGGAEDGPATA
jgi:hypothetical protein